MPIMRSALNDEIRLADEDESEDSLEYHVGDNVATGFGKSRRITKFGSS